MKADRLYLETTLQAKIKKNRQISLLPIFVSILPFLGLSAAVCANEKLREINDHIVILAESLEQKTVSAKDARNKILEIEQGLHAVAKEHKILNRALAPKLSRIDTLLEERARLEATQAAAGDAVRQTVAAQYLMWRQPKLKIFFANDNIAELRRNLKYYDYVSGANLEFLKEQARALERSRTLETTLKREAQKIHELQRQSAEQLRMLVTALDTHNDLAESLGHTLKASKHQLSLLREDELQLSKLFENATHQSAENPADNSAFARLKGGLNWPTLGVIAKPPGGPMRVGGAKWSGVVIESDLGAAVHAVADGQVAFANWFRNLGLLMVVDHGDGYMSLYGHNEELYKDIGDTVEAGERIAAVGDTGGISSAGLYFEIRRNGMPQDPRHWCKK